jgi:hypothetical protein
MYKGDGFELCEFDILTKESSLFPTQDVISCVRDTEVSSAYIFQRRIHTSKHTQTLIIVK